MLQIMRKNAKNWLMKVLLIIICAVFVLYFGAMRGSRTAETIAVIGNRHIAYAEFQREYQDTLDAIRARYGNNLTDDLLKSLNPKEQAYTQLIDRAVILHMADEMNLSVDDEELRQLIVSYPAFRVNGVFDQNRYVQVLRQNRLTPEDFEVMQRRSLIIRKMENLVTESVKVSDDEVYELYRMQNEKVNLAALTIPADSFQASIKPSKGDLETYLKDHAEDFRRPKTIDTSYAFYAAREFGRHFTPSDELIEDYYASHRASFTDENNTEKPLDEVRTEIIGKLQLLRGLDLAAQAAKEAHDVIYQEENFDAYMKENGRDTADASFASGENIPPPFQRLASLSDELFSREGGDISPVLCDDKGCYLFHIDTVHPSSIPHLEEIKSAVTEAYVTEKAGQMSMEKAGTLLARLQDGEPIGKIAEEDGVTLVETGLFVPDADIPKIGYAPEIAQALFDLTEQDPHGKTPFFVDGKAVIVSLTERGGLDETKWASERDKMRQYLVSMKERQYFMSWLQDTKEQLIAKKVLQIKKDISTI